MSWPPSRLAVLLAVPFAVAVVLDVADLWWERSRGEGSLLRDVTVRFEPHDRVLRVGELEAGDDSSETPWTSGFLEPAGAAGRLGPDGGTVAVGLATDRTRLVVIEARRGPGPEAPATLTVEADGHTLGVLRLRPRFHEHRLPVPPRTLGPGRCRLRLQPGPGDGPISAVIRTVALVASRHPNLGRIAHGGAIAVNPDSGAVSLTAPGRLEIEVPPSPVAAELELSLRFLTPDATLPGGSVRVTPRTPGGEALAPTRRLRADRAMWHREELPAPAGAPLVLEILVDRLEPTERVVVDGLDRRAS